jgi:hypothetical protein
LRLLIALAMSEWFSLRAFPKSWRYARGKFVRATHEQKIRESGK